MENPFKKLDDDERKFAIRYIAIAGLILATYLLYYNIEFRIRVEVVRHNCTEEAREVTVEKTEIPNVYKASIPIYYNKENPNVEYWEVYWWSLGVRTQHMSIRPYPYKSKADSRIRESVFRILD